jgi:hypothetical protein
MVIRIVYFYMNSSFQDKDVRLDVTSDLFDSELALRSKQMILPLPHVTPLDNLSKCRILLEEPLIDLYTWKPTKKVPKPIDRRKQYMEAKWKRLQRCESHSTIWHSLKKPGYKYHI